MKKNRIIIALMALSVLACSCSKTETSAPDEMELVDVELTLSASSTPGDTQSDMPLFPEQENWIWDFYYIQYDDMGNSLASGHIRDGATSGELSVTASVKLWKAQETTVLVIANIVPAGTSYGDDPHWQVGTSIFVGGQAYLSTAKTTKFDMSTRLARDAEGHYSTLKHMPMCGYWSGDFDQETGNYPINIALGRMITRMNVNIKNDSAYEITRVTLNNVAKNAYVFPQASNTPLDPANDYFSAPIVQTVSIPAGASQTLYFYSAPNYCTDGGKITTIQFHTDTKASDVKKLGSYIVDESNESENDYNLYMNTIYTYNLTVN